MSDVDDSDKLKSEELGFLETWHYPSWLHVPPDHEAYTNFMASLLGDSGGNGLRAWHRIDANLSMRVTWDEFAEAAGRLPDQVMHDNLCGIWRCFDDNLSGCISLVEFDEATHSLLSRFKAFCLKRAGSVVEAVGLMDRRERGVVRQKDW